MTTQTEIDSKGAGFWVHAAEEHRADELEALLERFTVIDQLVVDDLADQADWRLRQVLVLLRHVQVIEEVDHNLTSGWALSRTSLGANGTLDDVLKCA